MDFLERLLGKHIATSLHGTEDEELWWFEDQGGMLPIAAHWIPPGESVTVRQIEIPGGMIYVGETARYYGLNPEVIDPELPVRKASGQPTPGYYNRYYCSYAALSEEERYAYLSWLAGGRTAPTVPSQFLFLFFYGLEQRVLGEHLYQDGSPELTRELNEIRSEVVALTERYGKAHPSFLAHARQFLFTVDMIFFEVLSAETITEPPPLIVGEHRVPISFHLAIDRFTAERAPVPPEWALVWAWHEPDNRLRTPARRCTDEFAELFRLRYQERYGEGLTIRPVQQMLRTSYWPAHPGMGPVELTSTDIHDAFAHRATGRKLIALSNEVTEELQAYSRWIARDDPSRPPLQGVAQLPAPLLENRSEMVELREWLETHVTDPAGTVIEASDIMRFIVPADSDKLTTSLFTSLATLLDATGYGIVPDMRIDSTAIRAGDKVVLFRNDAPASEWLDIYPTATPLLRFAVAVMSADGPATPHDLATIRQVVRDRVDPPPGQLARLDAHLLWLSRQQVRLTGLKRRIEMMTDAQRQDTGDILVTLASRGRAATPKQVDVVTRAFKQLGLDSSGVIGQLHDRMTASPVDEPVSVRPAQAGDPGEPLPRTSAERLNPTVIERKQQETDDVSALLGTIFDDEDEADIAPVAQPDPQAGNPSSIEGLDAAHEALLLALLERDEWPRGDYEALAASHGLMPDGALDALNEFALDITGDMLVETGDPITVNQHIRKELPL